MGKDICNMIVLPDLKKKVIVFLCLNVQLISQISTRNGVESLTLSAVPGFSDNVSLLTHLSALIRAWYELFSFSLEIPVEIICTN